MRWGLKGKGTWITVYTNPGHAFAVIAGLRLDTSAYAVPSRVSRRYPAATQKGPRWRPTSRPANGYRVRHPLGL